MMLNSWVFAVVLSLSVIASFTSHRGDLETDFVSADTEELVLLVQNPDANSSSSLLQYDFYRETCPQAQKAVWFKMKKILSQHKNATAQLLRLFFHDCFIEGCDASILLDDSNGNNNQSERRAIPNKTLKGYDFVDTIKEELENMCPGVVSCADILVLATRDGIVLSGGPFFPILTGRRDSGQSFYEGAMAGIPRPDGNITETLRLFALRGFDERETVTLLGGHSIGKIGCEFIRTRLSNFSGTELPDPSIPTDFLGVMRTNCQDSNSNFKSGGGSSVMRRRGLSEHKSSSSMGMTYLQALSASISSGDVFNTHYYQSLVRGRGLLFADQQLMANEKTARHVRDYAWDDGTIFRMEFARVMLKMSSLGVLTGSKGQVRLNCSMPLITSPN